MSINFSPYIPRHDPDGSPVDNECSTCLNENTPEQSLMHVTPQGVVHAFHENCIMAWLQTQQIHRARLQCPYMCPERIRHIELHHPVDLPDRPSLGRRVWELFRDVFTNRALLANIINLSTLLILLSFTDCSFERKLFDYNIILDTLQWLGILQAIDDPSLLRCTLSTISENVQDLLQFSLFKEYHFGRYSLAGRSLSFCFYLNLFLAIARPLSRFIRESCNDENQVEQVVRNWVEPQIEEIKEPEAKAE